MNAQTVEIRFQESTAKLFKILAFLGLLTLIAGLLFAPQRTWANLLLLSFGLVGFGLGGTLFVAIQYLSGAGWATALRRIPEAMFMMLPIGLIGIALVLVFRPALYAWTNPGPELEHLMGGFKGQWLDRSFFLGRAAVYMLAWLFLARRIVATSRREDSAPGPHHTRQNGKNSAAFLVVFAVTFCLASFDWIMSLEPEWFSTIFGVYNFAGMFVGTLALMTLQAIWMRRQGAFRNVLTDEHLHDLGKLILGFSTFWAYMWFSQYMLIWYSNQPEETSYFIRRQEGAWASLFLLNFIINWAVPFLVLLPLRTKRSASVMAKVAVLLLLGRWLDLYMMVLPPISGSEGPWFGIWEIGLLLGVIGLVPLLMIRGLQAAPLIPVNDPRLQQSLHYHN